MKNVIAIVILAVIVDAAYWEQSHNYFGSHGIPRSQRNNGDGRRDNPFNNPFFPFNNPIWHHDHHEDNAFLESSYNNADWICRNPTTGDMMIINSQNIPGGTSERQHWHHHSHYPHRNTQSRPGHDTHPWENSHHDHHNQWPTTPENETGGNVNTPTTEKPRTTSPENQTERSHGGEGLIDVRIGSEKK